MDARRGPRHVPAAAPSGHAVRDRGALGGAAASGQRPGAADRRPLARGAASATRPRRPRSARSIELVTEIRNARASAKLPAADWLETLVFVPHELGLDASRRSARPSSGWPARGRSHRELTPEALAAASRPGDLAVIVARRRDRGGHPSGGRREDAGALERARLERELAEAEGWLAAARDRLANDAFVSKAPPPVVDGARAREAELADQVERLRDRLGR